LLSIAAANPDSWFRSSGEPEQAARDEQCLRRMKRLRQMGLIKQMDVTGEMPDLEDVADERTSPSTAPCLGKKR
jgi:hypothetical protein